MAGRESSEEQIGRRSAPSSWLRGLLLRRLLLHEGGLLQRVLLPPPLNENADERDQIYRSQDRTGSPVARNGHDAGADQAGHPDRETEPCSKRGTSPEDAKRSGLHVAAMRCLLCDLVHHQVDKLWANLGIAPQHVGRRKGARLNRKRGVRNSQVRLRADHRLRLPRLGNKPAVLTHFAGPVAAMAPRMSLPTACQSSAMERQSAAHGSRKRAPRKAEPNVTPPRSTGHPKPQNRPARKG